MFKTLYNEIPKKKASGSQEDLYLRVPGNSKNSYDKKNPQVYVRYHKT